MKPDDDDDNEGSFFFFFFHKPLENSKLTWKSFFFSFCLCVSQALGITESLSITADNLGEEGGNSKVWATFICRRSRNQQQQQQQPPPPPELLAPEASQPASQPASQQHNDVTKPRINKSKTTRARERE